MKSKDKRKSKTDKEKFFQFRLGRGVRVNYSYRILYFQCECCGYIDYFGVKGKGRVKDKRACRQCGDLAHLVMVEKHKVTRVS